MPTLFITGANRGLGLGLTQAYLNKQWQVIATCRSPEQASDLHQLQAQYPQQLSIKALDMLDENAIRELKTSISCPIDLLFLNAGFFGSSLTLDSLKPASMLETYRINVIGPTLVAQALMSQVLKSDRKQIVAMSSTLGSIDDNQSGSYYDYRASKCALNMVMKTIAAEYAAQNLHVTLMHPGWVQTRMGGKNAPLTIPQSIAGMTQVVDQVLNQASGQFYGYDGNPIKW